MKLFERIKMRFFILISISLYLSTALYAKSTLETYLDMKKEAYTLYENNKKNEAIRHAEEFIAQYPESIRGQNLLAVLYYWSGDYTNAKITLKEILKKEEFEQARLLLQRIEKKEGLIPSAATKTKHVTKAKKVVKKVKNTSKKGRNVTADLMVLIKNVKSDPTDIISRKILVQHYEKIGNTRQALYFANEALKIDPDDREMIVYLKSKDQNINAYASKERQEQALAKLESFYQSSKYDQFMNLYNALEHNNIVLPTEVHVNALQVSIELKTYQKAKSILHTHRMPQSKYVAQVEKLLDEKILIQRFSALED